MILFRTLCLGFFSALILACQVLVLSARPEQVVPSGGGPLVILVDLDRPVQFVAGVQAMVGEMILSVADKCEDPLDAKAALCLRHLRSAVTKAHSFAFFASEDYGLIALEADLTSAFSAKFKSVSSMRKFGSRSARAATFGALWGDDAGSLKDELLVMAPDGRLLAGDLNAISQALATLAGHDYYLPTYGADTGLHYLAVPSVVGLDDYERMGARRLILDYKVGTKGRDEFRFELKCNSAREAKVILPKVSEDGARFFAPILIKVMQVKDPGMTIEEFQKAINKGLKEEIKIFENSLILEAKDGSFDMNAQELRIYLENIVLLGFKKGK